MSGSPVERVATMTTERRDPIARPLLRLLAVWLLPGLAASAGLLQLFSSDPWGTLLHGIVLVALLWTVLLPLLPDLLRNLPCPSRAVRWTAAAMAALHLMLLVFYGLAWVGHRFWGNWLNLELALAYMPQLPALMQAMDIARGWALVGVAVLAGCWWLLWRLHTGLLQRVVDARREVPRVVSHRQGLLLLVALPASLMLLYRSHYVELEFWWIEPLRQAGHSASFGQAGMGIALSPENLHAEQAVAATYPPRPVVPPGGKMRPLVLIIVDALRADQAEVAGAPVPNAPFLSSLLRSGQLQRVDDAYSVCTVSYCGILATVASRQWHRMTPQPWGLADALGRLGYESRFFLSGDHTSFYGLRTMYGSAPSLLIDGGSQSVRYSNDDRLVLDALDAHGWPREKPGFLYVHLMSAHRLGLIDDAHKRWTADNAPSYSRFGTLDPKDSPETRARYHNGILQADAMIAQIFQRLERLGVLNDALVIITADHGEGLGEEGRWSHGHMPYEPMVRIPLLVFDRQIRTPLPPRRLASHIDVAPTFLHAIGAPVPAHWSGVPLQQQLQRAALLLQSADASGLVTDDGQARYKYLRPRDGGAELLYRLDGPGGGESVNLSRNPEHAAVLARQRAVLEQLLTDSP
jgi:Sulfatase